MRAGRGGGRVMKAVIDDKRGENTAEVLQKICRGWERQRREPVPNKTDDVGKLKTERRRLQSSSGVPRA